LDGFPAWVVRYGIRFNPFFAPFVPLSRDLPLVIIILKSDASEEQIGHVVESVEGLGFKAHLSRGTFRTIIGLIGDETKISPDSLRAIPGVADVIPVLPPYKLASKEAHPQPSVVDVSGVKVGGGRSEEH